MQARVWTFQREAELRGEERKVGGGGRASPGGQSLLSGGRFRAPAFSRKVAMMAVASHCFTLLCQVWLSQVRLRFGASSQHSP